jgi:hypothetical protein
MHARLSFLWILLWVVCGTVAASDAAPPPLRDKTLVAWATVSDLAQRGGSLITVQTGEDFDAVVFGEAVAQRWMAGSDFFRRTQAVAEQEGCSAETVDTEQLVQIAIVYSGPQITVYRNGERYTTYTIAAPRAFDEYLVLLGLRYLGSMGAIGHLRGTIEEARLYDKNLSHEEIAELRVNEPSTPAPIGWWTFEAGTATDVTGHFPVGTLVGGARIEGGRLYLDGTDACVVIEQTVSGPQHMFYRPHDRATGRMWDTWLFHRDGVYYLYYLANCGNSWDNISLATSPDGVHWSEQGVILRKRPDAVWMGTGSTWASPVPHDPPKYFLNFSEWRGEQQTIFFAESTDLVHWNRLEDRYEFKPDPQWYRVNEGNNSRWDCIYTIPRSQGGLFGYWTATPKPDTEGRFGFGETTDGVTWKSLPPPVVHGMEVGEAGAVERIGDRYYMMYGTGGIMVTLVADRPEGPFEPAKANLRLLAGHTYFSRFFPSPDGLLVNHHSIARSGMVYFAPLKATQVDAEGTLRLVWWRGNEKLKHTAVAVDDTLAQEASNPRLAWMSPTFALEDGLVLEGHLPLPPDATSPPTGLLIETTPGQGVAIRVAANGAVEIGPQQIDGTGFVAEKSVDRQWAFGATTRFRLLLKPTVMEFYLDDLLIECFSLAEPASGRLGVIGQHDNNIFNLRAWK